MTKKLTIFSREDLLAARQSHQLLIIYAQNVYDVTKFTSCHPGGALILEHMAGLESTGLIEAFHPKFVIDNHMPRFLVGKYSDNLDIDGKPVYPSRDADVIDDLIGQGDSVIKCDPECVLATAPSHPVHSDSQDSLVSSPSIDVSDEKAIAKAVVIHRAMTAMNGKFHSDGLYDYDLSFYVYRGAFLLGVLAGVFWLVLAYPSSPACITVAAMLLSFFWHGMSFIAHDIGHNAVSGNRYWDVRVGSAFVSALGGLSLGWWKANHNVHHVMTNDPEHDPDIQHIPFIVVSPRFSGSLFSTYHKRVLHFGRIAQTLVSYQHVLFYFILSFGRFNLYAQSFTFLMDFTAKDTRKKLRYFELAGLLMFFIWYGYLLVGSISGWPLRLLFIYLSHACNSLLHLQLALSHFSMPTEELHKREGFVEKALRTTMDMECPVWLDWLHGGLQFQIEHHLFPRLPRRNLRRARSAVMAFCLQHGLVYHSTTFIGLNRRVVQHLHGVAKEINSVVQQ